MKIEQFCCYNIHAFQMDVISWRFRYLWVLISWHLLSISLCICLLLSPMTSSINVLDDKDGIVAQDTPDLDIGDSNDNAATAISNHTEEQNVTKAASCDVDLKLFCPDDQECSSLRAECIQCDFNFSCVYGAKRKAMCSPLPEVNCTGEQTFEREYECRYCYQLPHWQTWCNHSMDCALNKPRSFYPAKPFFMSTCWAQSKYLCLGRRCFHKQVSCNWSKGYKWSTTLLLSIFLGGFGVDRFYLGLWKAGIGKLLSFGGLGVWTLVDVILIAVGYVQPWDGSLYI